MHRRLRNDGNGERLTAAQSKGFSKQGTGGELRHDALVPPKIFLDNMNAAGEKKTEPGRITGAQYIAAGGKIAREIALRESL